MFLLCHNVNLVWRDIADWIGFVDYKAKNIKESFVKWYNFERKVKIWKDKEEVVWLAVNWYLWTVWNKIIFKGDMWNISEIVWGVKTLIWYWTIVGKIIQTNFVIFTNLVESPFFICRKTQLTSNFLFEDLCPSFFYHVFENLESLFNIFLCLKKMSPHFKYFLI